MLHCTARLTPCVRSLLINVQCRFALHDLPHCACPYRLVAHLTQDGHQPAVVVYNVLQHEHAHCTHAHSRKALYRAIVCSERPAGVCERFETKAAHPGHEPKLRLREALQQRRQAARSLIPHCPMVGACTYRVCVLDFLGLRTNLQLIGLAP